MRHFFVDVSGDRDLQTGDTVTLDRDESHHLFTVLRGGRQQVLHLVDGHGRRLTGELAGKDGRCAQVRLLSVARDEEEAAPPHLVLVCAVVKGKRFEWVLEKAVELGAHAVWPLLTEHGVIDPGDGKRERWLHLLRSALKQSGRARLPDLTEPRSLSAAIAHLTDATVLFGDLPDTADAEAHDDTTRTGAWTDLLAQPPQPRPDRLAICIGPEGGWSDGERAALLAAGGWPISLGPHTLRTETAAVVGLAALQTLRQAWSDR